MQVGKTRKNGGMKLEKAFPEIFKTRIPNVQPDTTTLNAILILRSTGLDVLPIESKEEATASESEQHRRTLAISGYSIVAKLNETSPRSYGKLLSEPCLHCALTLGTVSYEKSDIPSLLHVFETSTFGFALVESSTRGARVNALVGIRDLLGLYERGLLASNLVVQDVASTPVFSVPRNIAIREAFGEMVRRKFRRVLLQDTGKVVSDKEILAAVFREDRMKDAPHTLLDGTLERVEASDALKVEDKQKISETAGLLSKDGRDCALSSKGIITPWDLIIKPWRLGELHIE